MDCYINPLQTLSLRQLRRFARRAARSRAESVDAIGRLAERSGVGRRELLMLADAWEAGGDHGVAVLKGAVGSIPEVEIEGIDTALEEWRRRHYPLETLEWEVWRSQVTVWQIVPARRRLDPAERRGVAQFRRDDAGEWHLYRRAREDEWWPARTPLPGRDLHACLEVVREDTGRQFWPVSPPIGTPGDALRDHQGG